jgi:hypothetical protein
VEIVEREFMSIRSNRLSVLGLICLLGSGACTSDSSESSAASTSAGTQSPSAASSVDPMTVARLDGVYDVVKKVVAEKNFSDIKVGDTSKRTYDVTLTCATGACNGTVAIDAKDLPKTVKQNVIYDTSTHSYSFKAPLGSATCSGVDGKTYKLATTATFTLTPKKVALTGSDYIVTTFTAVGTLKAVPHGGAVSGGGCKTSTAKYTYSGQLR